MKKLALIAALPAALALAACGDASSEVDGSDTASMEADAVEPMDSGMTEPVPAETGMMAEDGMAADGTMTEDPMTADPMTATPAPTATATPM